MNPLYTPEKKKMIFFDMNHTLVDVNKTFEQCFTEALSEYSGRWDSDGGEPIDAEKSFAAYQAEWSRQLRSKPVLKLDARRQLCLAKALKPYPFAVTEFFTESFFSKMDELKASSWQLFADVGTTLEKLAGSYTMAIISNGGRERILAQIRQAELESFFPQTNVFTAAKQGFRKPNPAIFQQALQQTGVSPLNAVMVGNSWKNDIYGATRCGIDAVWFHPTHKMKWTHKRVGKEKVTVIRKFRQLLDLFEI